MESPQVLTGLKKRQLIMAANKTMFMWVVIASIVLGVSGVLSEFMFRQLMFNNKIIAAKGTTNDTIKANNASYEGLKSEVDKLYADTNLNLLRKGEDSTPLQVVLNALPVEDNKAAFAASMQLEVIAPTQARLDGFSISATEVFASPIAPTSETLSSSVVSVPFSFSINGQYSQIMAAINNMERSIRPMDIQYVKFEGSESSMKATITALTYYQPAKQISLQKEQVKP